MEEIKAVIAVYGAILSTIVFFWNVINYLYEKRLQLKIELTYSKGPLKDRITIKAVNHGKRPITLTQLGLDLLPITREDVVASDGTSIEKQSVRVIADLNKELTENQKYEYIYESDDIEPYQVKRGWLKDSTSEKKEWSSRLWPAYPSRKWWLSQPKPQLAVNTPGTGGEEKLRIDIENNGNVPIRIKDCGFCVTPLSNMTRDQVVKCPFFPSTLSPGEKGQATTKGLAISEYRVNYAYVDARSQLRWKAKSHSADKS